MKKILIASIVGIMAATISTRAADAKDLYAQSCTKCHGDDGKGATKMGQKLNCRDYSDAKVQDSMKDADATKALKEGLKDDKGKELMKPYADLLSDDDIKGLLAYIRAFKKP